ncbi:hypothetical protein AVEN_234793-1 [Araneus ventricosus]|uniref:Flavin-containing monooxygenase n=1 Tax=Araneus ventricosus TaxID=182803 RepID=A0A4Y2F4E0_ARAVE|nr:hypothetical protein AVEN_234793-1 [Araneus ventricosus]
MPSYPSQDLFKGKIMHTYSLKEVAPYKEKTVVVVGMGCSGLDAAVETSNVARQVRLSGGKVLTSGRRVLGSKYDLRTSMYVGLGLVKSEIGVKYLPAVLVRKGGEGMSAQVSSSSLDHS